MKTQSRLLLTCAIGAMIASIGAPTARAADQAMPVKAPPVEDGWWFHGYMELGGRGFLNDPNRGGILSKGTGDSLAKFYEYRDLRPGAFGDFWFATGTKNGLWQIDGWGKNPGYDDQAYQLNVSKAGEHYGTFTWDETPHVYSTSALTPYFGLGTNSLTLAPGLSGTLFGPAGAGCVAAPNSQPTGCASPLSAAAAARVQTLINGNVHQTDLGIRRDTAALDYRWTPTDDWDVKLNYSHTDRHGSGVDGITFSPGTSGVRVDAPRPIDDTTQNYGASGEYVGTSWWNQRFTFKLGYAGSTYTDKWDSYTIENPFCPAGAATNTTTQGFCARNGLPSTPLALVSLPPSNDANGVNATFAADLPYKSRYMGTFSWTRMRQDDPFLPFGSNPTVFNGTTGSNNFTAAAVGAMAAVPFSSLNGQIDETLSNNVLTTQIAPELKNKASYRYYDFNNGTPRMTFANWVVADTELATNASTSFAPVSSLPVAYTKQNAGDELVWRPWHSLNLGVAYGFERYDWNFEAANVTNEHSGKIFADWKATPDITARASWLVSARRFDNYDYNNNMAMTQWPGAFVPGNQAATRSVTAMREFYLNDRDRNIAKAQVDWSPIAQLTISPNAGLQYDDYLMDAASGIGLNYSHEWRAGVEGTYVFAPGTSLLVSYMFEHYHQYLIGSTATGASNPFAPGSIYQSDIVDDIHTVTAAVNWAAIPNKLDLRFSYAASFSTDTQPVIFGTGNGPSSGQYPAVTNVWQRLDASAKYHFDRDWVHSLGWRGDVYAKLMYAWERNSMGNWANDIMNTYMFNVTANSGYMTWMAYDNPNYNVHMIAGAIGFGW
jgi:MtrB/PioB family decaheme-associated outer membrane protein